MRANQGTCGLVGLLPGMFWLAWVASTSLGVACSSGARNIPHVDASPTGSGGAGGGGGLDAAAGANAGGGGTATAGDGGPDAVAGSGGTTPVDAGAGDTATQDALTINRDAGDQSASGPLAIDASVALARMTQLLWSAPPDAPLMAALGGGTYVYNGDLLPFAQAILADPRARKGVGAFYRWWLGLDGLATIVKDPQLFPQLTADLRASMAAETETFGVAVTLDEDGLLSTLLEAPYSFVDANVAAIYGLTNFTGTAMTKVDVNTLTRSGILTQPSVMTLLSGPTLTSPSQRGVFMMQKLMCQEVPAPPPGSPPLTPPGPGVTTRSALEQETTFVECHACHGVIDAMGFPFEGLDPIGRSRATDNGAPVDTSTVLPTGEHLVGARELSSFLAVNAGVSKCMAVQWLTFALGRPLTSADDASLSLVSQTFSTSGERLRDLITAVLTSPVFLAK